MKELTGRSFILVLILIGSGGREAPAQGPVGTSPLNPAPAGVTLSGIVECGKGYTSHELYDMKITLLEVLRGEKAWNRIQAAGSSNEPPEPGHDYILARIRFEYYARGSPGLCIHEVKPEQFTAFSANGGEYSSPSILLPKPELRGNLRSGESQEGWVAFAVSGEDKRPLMTYSADIGGAIMHGGGKWFRLE